MVTWICCWVASWRMWPTKRSWKLLHYCKKKSRFFLISKSRPACSPSVSEIIVSFWLKPLTTRPIHEDQSYSSLEIFNEIRITINAVFLFLTTVTFSISKLPYLNFKLQWSFSTCRWNLSKLLLLSLPTMVHWLTRNCRLSITTCWMPPFSTWKRIALNF